MQSSSMRATTRQPPSIASTGSSRSTIDNVGCSCRWRRSEGWTTDDLVPFCNAAMFGLQVRKRKATARGGQNGRAHGRTPVHNAHLGCRLVIEKTKNTSLTIDN